MSGRLTTGAHHQPSATRDNYASRDLNSFLLPARSILKLGDITQVALDVGAVIFIALFLCAAAISFPVGLFILFFVRI